MKLDPIDTAASFPLRPMGRLAAAPRDLPRLGEGAYLVRFAEGPEDVWRVQRLRYEVFCLELGEGVQAAGTSGLDRDAFDGVCDHLMVEVARTGELVGTYRLQTAETAAASGLGFYCDQEFVLADLPPALLETHVELGRACIARRHRNGTALFALWRGLAAYALALEKHGYFGCSSLTSTDPAEGRRALRTLARAGHLHASLACRTRAEHDCGPAAPGDERPVAIPPLFAAYLRHGARVLGGPALDRAFGTVDFLVALDLDRLAGRTRRLFLSGLVPALRRGRGPLGGAA